MSDDESGKPKKGKKNKKEVEEEENSDDEKPKPKPKSKGKKDKKVPIKYFRKGCSQFLVRAQVRISTMYQNGLFSSFYSLLIQAIL